MEHEAALLTAAGHVVERFTLPPAETTGASGLASGLKAIWNVEACRAVGRLMDGFGPDVVHVHTPFPLLSPAIFRVVAGRRAPAVTTAHSYRYSCIAGTCLRDGEICEACVGQVWKLPGVRHRCYHDSRAASSALTLSLATHHLLGTFRHHVGRFITLTDFARGMLIRDGVPPDKVVVKPNSVPDPGVPSPRVGPPSYAAFVGRLVEEKGVRTLLAAWRAVGDRMPLRVAGDGPLRPLVERAAADNSAVEYVGWLDEAGLDGFVAGAEVLIVPSEWYEAGEPLVLLRALAAGRPVVVSDLDNLSARVRETHSGVTFRTGDAADLADTVINSLAGLAELRSMGIRGRRTYERHFTPERNREQLEQIYRAVQQ